MMATTGQVYLQAYNRSLDKFQEYPTGLVGLNLVIRPTGVGIFPFSGLSISNINIDKIDTDAVNIGKTNIIFDKGISIGRLNSSFPRANILNADNINIGTFNSASGSNLINIGAGNSLNDVSSSLNIGRTSTVYKSSLVNNIGSFNKVSGINTLFNLGSYNIFVRSKSAEQAKASDVWEVYTFGDYNSFISGAKNIINIGDGNYFQVARNATLLGNNNSIYDSNITGYSSITIGDDNSSSESTQYIVFGIGNNIYSSQQQIVIGMNNSNINQNPTIGNLIVGFENATSGSNNYILGENNFILGNQAFILGDGNTTLLNGNSDVIIGSTNLVSGTYNNYIFGDNNNIGRYNTGTLHNFYIGQSNLSNSGSNNYVIGYSNDSSIINDSYIIGKENIIKNTNENYIFGTNNEISGLGTFVIGRDNTIKTGDYNSILIGYDYQETGRNKNNTIMLYSSNGSFQISQDGINMYSDIRPKYNNNNLILGEDLQGYAKESQIIGRSGFYSSTVFQDANYNLNAEEIQLQTFNYSGRGERYYPTLQDSSPTFLGFTGLDYNKSLYRFYPNNYFRKIPSYFYTGNYSILGPYFYESNNKDLILSYTTDVGFGPGKWTIRRSEGQGCFYVNRTSTDFNSMPPTTGWRATGFMGLSGGNPAPQFKLVTEFTGVFYQQKLKQGFNKAYKFNADISYPSDEISVIHGAHINSQFEPTWLIVDNFSSGVYYINNNYNSNQTPQINWSITGFAGASGFYTNPDDAPITKLQGTTGVNLSMGTRVGLIATDISAAGGRIYIPYFY